MFRSRFFPCLLLLAILCLSELSFPSLSHAALDEEVEYKEKSSGWTLGTDQGVLFFIGDSAGLVNPQYYGTIYGGYNIKGIFMPMVRLGQAYGSLSGFGNPSTYWFSMEGGFRVTPLRTKVRPFFLASAGFYVLSFTDLGTPVDNGLNFTFSGGGGLEVEFGPSALTVEGAYHGFANGGPYLEGISVTLGYRYQF